MPDGSVGGPFDASPSSTGPSPRNLANEALARTKAGSRARQIVEIAGMLAVRMGRGATIAELRAAFAASTGAEAPASFTAEVASLARRGVLAMVGGRSSRSQYAPVGMMLPDVPLQPVVDDTVAVSQALMRAYHRTGAPVSTRDVRMELRAAGHTLQSESINAVRKALMTLTTPRRRGAASFRGAQATLIRRPRATGSSADFWMPVAAPPGELQATISRSEALRCAVRDCSALLGRAVTKQELRWWVEREVLSGRVTGLSPADVSPTLAALARTDGRHPGAAGRVHTVTTKWTALGGPVPRYTLGPPSVQDTRRAHLEDLVLTLRLGDEWESIAALERRAEALRSEALGDWAWLRRRVCSRVVRGAWRWGEGEAVALDALAATGTMHQWTKDAAPHLRRGQLEHRERVLAERAAHIEVAVQLFRWDLASARPLRPIAVVGQDGSFSPSELKVWAQAAQRLARADDSTMRHALGSVRRLPPRLLEYPDGPESSGMPATLLKPGSDVDRPDAVAALYRLFNAPRTRALLRAGMSVLGTVVRDRNAVWDALVELPIGEHAARRAFVVAAGLLGQPTPLHLLGEAWHQPDDMAAWGLAQALALGPGEVALLLRVVAEEATPSGAVRASQRVLRQMQQRLESGHFFSALG